MDGEFFSLTYQLSLNFWTKFAQLSTIFPGMNKRNEIQPIFDEFSKSS